jgi:hypothetical protein
VVSGYVKNKGNGAAATTCSCFRWPPAWTSWLWGWAWPP